MSQSSSQNLSTPVAVQRARTKSISGLSIGQYLIRRLEDYDIKNIFGIPDDYVLSFYSMLEESAINVVGCTEWEQSASPIASVD